MRLFGLLVTYLALGCGVILTACTPERQNIRPRNSGMIRSAVSPTPLFIDHRLLDTSSFAQSWYVTYLRNYEHAVPTSGTYSGHYQDFSCLYCIQDFTVDLNIGSDVVGGSCSFAVAAFDDRKYRATGSVSGSTNASGQIQFVVRGSLDTTRTQAADSVHQLSFTLQFTGQGYRYYYGHTEAEHGPYYSIVGTLKDQSHKLLPDGVMNLTSITTH